MKARRFAQALLLALILTSSFVFADSFQLVTTAPENHNTAGVYTVPYYLSVNGGTPIATMCDSYFNETTFGQSWSGLTENGSNLAGAKFASDPSASQLYAEAAWLMSQYELNPTSSNANAINFAVWNMFAPAYGSSVTASQLSALNATYLSIPGATTWRTKADDWYSTAGTVSRNAMLSSLSVYTPDNNSISGPQEYISVSAVPEPASLLLMGTGLLAIGRLLRRRA